MTKLEPAHVIMLRAALDPVFYGRYQAGTVEDIAARLCAVKNRISREWDTATWDYVHNGPYWPRTFSPRSHHNSRVYRTGAAVSRLISLRARQRLDTLDPPWTASSVATLARKGSRIRAWWERAARALEENS